MPAPKAERYTFFVYIVESPSAPDLYHGRSEGDRVASTLRLDGIPCVTRTAINAEAFGAALTIGLPESMKQYPNYHPVIHLSAHGSDRGIQLSSGDVVEWSQLRELLLPINESLGGALMLCMSACEGYSACQMAMEIDDKPHPYFVMVGNYGKPTWSDTAVAYLAYYHLLAKGHNIPDAVAAMSAASGDRGWLCETADQSKQSYIEFLKTRSEPAEAQQQLEAAAESAPVPPDAKALEAGGDG
jgi:hypothetical protein